MFQRCTIAHHERAVFIRGGQPARALGPGRYWLRSGEVQRFPLEDLVFDAPPAVRALLPETWFEEFTLEDHERGVLFRDGTPVRYLRPGVHRRWCFDPGVELRRYNTRAPLEAASDALLALIPKNELVQCVVHDYERALLLVGGSARCELDAGVYRFWNRDDAPAEVRKVDLRPVQLTIAGQEIMTRDKVTLRLNLSVEYRVVDIRRALLERSDVRDALYLRVQLAVRDFVSSVKLDQLLERRGELDAHLASTVGNGAGLGIEILQLGLKDIILPGEMKTLLNQVIEAEKQAAARVILRRDDSAATKAMATSAKALSETAGAMRLKELEMFRDVAAQVGKLEVVLGSLDARPTRAD